MEHTYYIHINEPYILYTYKSISRMKWKRNKKKENVLKKGDGKGGWFSFYTKGLLL